MTALRGASETGALSFASKGVRVSIVQLPPSVHGENDEGFISGLIKAARKTGFSTYVGDGLNRWPTVHRHDAACLQACFGEGTAGSAFHAVAEDCVPIRGIAEVIGKHLNEPLFSKTSEEAQADLGFFALPLSDDNPTSSKQTQKLLGWHPSQPKLIPDIEQGHYFDNRMAGSMPCLRCGKQE